ncbi:hypothetical protein [Opitutus sp. GAS368]|jgi:hypothetical protein|uniref:hypothetical protein n=1 Tax=Opitutus sp. GAS368 TaxID=1882749 RepID=UPI00087A8547|nr:hypothetical protein [Opitutus sp. GAS368]SDS32421.1 hypothetical protein SAMN05444173_2549 [Opitutus sp. GAS368]
MKHPAQLLSPADYDLIIAHLNEWLAIFKKKKGSITTEELQVKDTLLTQLTEIRQKKKKSTATPFGA